MFDTDKKNVLNRIFNVTIKMKLIDDPFFCATDIIVAMHFYIRCKLFPFHPRKMLESKNIPVKFAMTANRVCKSP